MQELERVVDLPACPASAPQARREVAAALTLADRGRWADASLLAVSELVTNALLHARTPIGLTVRVCAASVRVEVRDASPAMPSPRAYDELATTGRGLALVATVTSAHGVRSLGADGKVVWFRVGDDAPVRSAWLDDDGHPYA